MTKKTQIYPLYKVEALTFLVFLLLTLCLVGMMLGYWMFILEPRFKASADAHAEALAYSQAQLLADKLFDSTKPPSADDLTRSIDKILLLTDTNTGDHFVLGVESFLDYDVIHAEKGSLDIARGQLSCTACIVTEVPLYNRETAELTGKAKFYISNEFLERIKSDMRVKFIIVSFVFVILISLAWWPVSRMMKKLKYFAEQLGKSKENLEQMVEQRTMELKNALDSLKQSQERLIQSEKMASFGRLGVRIAHEINNPLSNISLKIQTIKSKIASDDDNGPVVAKLESIERSIDRVSYITRELLLISRSGPENLIPVNINDAIDEAIILLEYKLEHLTIHKNMADVPAVMGDPVKLEQVFVNIIDNSIYAMSGKGDIFINSYCDNNMVICEIIDTGTGITQESLKNVFEPFYTTKKVGDGTGLGLSICYGIISQHNGTIHLKSTGNEGTTVTIKIPAGDQV